MDDRASAGPVAGHLDAGGPHTDGPDTDGLDTDSLGDILAAVLAAEGVHGTAEAGLHLVDADEMARLNLEAMGRSGPTDVLSFPIDGNSLAADDATGSPGSTPPRLVGDVVLCPEVAMANAPSHAGRIDDECRLLVVHGGLHLCGWDHSTAEELAAMWLRERQLMEQLGVLPSRDPWTTR